MNEVLRREGHVCMCGAPTRALTGVALCHEYIQVSNVTSVNLFKLEYLAFLTIQVLNTYAIKLFRGIQESTS